MRLTTSELRQLVELFSQQSVANDRSEKWRKSPARLGVWIVFFAGLALYVALAVDVWYAPLDKEQACSSTTHTTVGHADSTTEVCPARQVPGWLVPSLAPLVLPAPLLEVLIRRGGAIKFELPGTSVTFEGDAVGADAVTQSLLNFAAKKAKKPKG